MRTGDTVPQRVASGIRVAGYRQGALEHWRPCRKHEAACLSYRLLGCRVEASAGLEMGAVSGVPSHIPPLIEASHFGMSHRVSIKFCVESALSP
jgi:hypothetical protein